jgi:hypothetical protein
VLEKKFQGMVVEMVFNNKIQFFFPNQFIFKKEKNIFVHIIERTLRLNFNLVIWTKY